MAEAAMEQQHQGAKRRTFPWKIAGLVGIVAVLVAINQIFPLDEYTVNFLRWVEGLGIWGYLVFALLYILFTVLFLPGFILTVGAGTIFGLLWGFIVVSIGSTIGASLAFLIGRFVARDAIEKKVSGSAKFAAVDRAVADRGWKIVFLTRLSPVFPFNLINYAYGLTKVKFWHYALASWIGMMPGTLVYVYIGALAGTVAQAAAGEVEGGGTGRMIINVVGLLAAIAVTAYVTQVARKALAEAVPEEDKEARPEAGSNP